MDDYLIAVFKVELALKTGTFLAGIWTLAPVLGLRPVRALRVFTLKVPKPAMDTFPFCFKVWVISPTMVVTARPAAALLILAALATFSINTTLFIYTHLL
jgi:hypothetical protein